MNIEIIAASPRKESNSFSVAQYFQQYIQQHTPYSAHIINIRNYELTPFQQTIFTTAEEALPALQTLAQHMFAADAFLIVSPEYNGSYTAPLKNLFDHFPKQYHKAFGIATVSTGALGGIRAAMQLQLLVNALFGIASPYLLVTPFVHQKFDAEGHLADKSFQPKIDEFFAEFLWLARCLYAAKEQSESN